MDDPGNDFHARRLLQRLLTVGSRGSWWRGWCTSLWPARTAPRNLPEVLSVYTDGSSDGQPGRAGGWAYVIVRRGSVLLEGAGADASTTSSSMELRAAHEGLSAVLSRGWHKGAIVELVSDSRVTLDVACGAYLPATDVSLAKALRQACIDASARTRWVKGHSGDMWNEQVDALAETAKQTRLPARVRKRAARRRRGASKSPV